MDYSQAVTELMKEMGTHFRTGEFEKINQFSKGEKFIMNYLLSRNAPVLPSELSAAAGNSSARIAATLGSLERKGMIIREMDTTDRRKILVSMTEVGRQKITHAKKDMHDMIEAVFREMGEEDTVAFIKALRCFGEAFTKVHASGGGCTHHK